MTKDIVSKKIILYDIIGFGIVIVILWSNEIMDIPHLIFGTSRTPVNTMESVMETAIVLLLSIAVIKFTWSLLQRIKYLEGLLPVCSFCKKIRIDGAWIPIVDYIRDHSEAEFTHGCCPDCVAEHYGNILNGEKRVISKGAHSA